MGDNRNETNKRNWGKYRQSTSDVPHHQAPRYGARSGYGSSKLGLEEKEGLSIYNVAGLFLSPLESLKHHFKAWREERRGYKLARQMTRSLVKRHCKMLGCESSVRIASALMPLLAIFSMMAPLIIGIESAVFIASPHPIPIPILGAMTPIFVLSGLCAVGVILATILIIVLAPRAINERRDRMAEILGFESRHEMCRVLVSSDEENIIRAENVSNCMKLYEVAYEVSDAEDHGASAGVSTTAFTQIDGIMKRAPGVAVKLAEEALRKHGLLATEVTQGGKDFLCNNEGDLLKYDDLKETPKYEACFDAYFDMVDKAYNFMHESKTKDWGNILNSDRGNMNDGARIMMECMERARPTKDRHQFSSVESSINVDKEMVCKPLDKHEKDSNVPEKH